MKKIISIILILATILTSFSILCFAEAEEPNIIKNFTFETGNEGWYTFGNSQAIVHENRSQDSDNYCVAVTNGTQSWVSPAVNIYHYLKAGGEGTYTINAEVKYNHGTNNDVEARMMLRSSAETTFLELKATDGTYYEDIGVKTYLNMQRWTNISGSFKVQADDIAADDGEIVLCFDNLATAYADGKLSVDNVVICKLDNRGITNGDFSYGTVGWRNWSSYGNFTTMTDELLGISFADYVKASTYGSIATNVDHIIKYYGSTEYRFTCKLKLFGDAYENLERFAIYLTKGEAEYHYCLKNITLDDISHNQWYEVEASINMNNLANEAGDTLFELFTSGAEVFIRMQYTGAETATDASYLITDVTFEPVRYIKFATDKQKMLVGETGSACAAVDGDFDDPGNIAYVSSDPEVATVDRTTGQITALKPGIIKIFAYYAPNEAFYAVSQLKIGHEIIINGNTLFICAEIEETSEEIFDTSATGLNVYVDEEQITSAKEEANGDVTACIMEVAEKLATDYFVFIEQGYVDITVAHYDIEELYSKRYNVGELDICDEHGVPHKISLTQFIDDLGYAKKCVDVAYSNGARFIILKGWQPERNVDVGLIVGTLVSMSISFIPVIGDIKDTIEAVSGEDIITGQPLDDLDRLVNVTVGYISYVNGVAVRVGRRGFTTIETLAKYSDDISDTCKVVLNTDVWNVLRPTTRGLFIEACLAENVYKFVDGWHHIGETMNGFFPVVDFLKQGEKATDAIAVSVKTLDPNLYKLADGTLNNKKITNVLTGYVNKLVNTEMRVDDIMIVNRKLDLCVPAGYKSDIEKILKDIIAAQKTAGINLTTVTREI